MAESENATITPMLSVHDAGAAIAWYQKAFGAEEVFRLTDDAGRVTHCELRISEAPLMVADEFPDIDVRGPMTIGGTPVMLLLEVPDVDRVFAEAVAAGAVSTRTVSGDTLRNGKLTDPFGHHWMILTRDPAGPELA